MLRIVVLISGGGTTLENLIDRIRNRRLRNVRITGVISSRSSVRGVEIARAAGLPLVVIRRRDYDDHRTFGDAVFAAVRAFGADLVVMGGYLCYLPLPEDFTRRVLNIHPALLPDHGGAGMYGPSVHKAVLASGARRTGCTVHLADDQYDHGPIIAQAATEVRPDDTAESLAARVGELERELYPAVLQQIADRGVEWLDDPAKWPARNQ